MQFRAARSAVLALVCLVGAGPSLAQPPAGNAAAGKASSADLQAAIEQARDRVFPALVNIQTVTVSYWSGSESKSAQIGSGTIISADGLILTNNHVVEDGRSFRITLSDKRELPATLVGADPLTDLAVLKINVTDLKGGPLPAVATYGDSDTLRVGDYVLAMGAPYGLTRSVTLGVVSNTERVFTGSASDEIADQEFDFDTSSDIFTRWIQHDALILPGNSGGPLVNLKGEVVGVNTRGGSGFGFANPAMQARRVAAALAKDGEVIRSDIGAAFKAVGRAGLTEGVLLNSVNEDSPAAKAGLKPGDVILSMDGKSITARFPEEIPLVLRSIADRPVGTSIDIEYRREGESHKTAVVTEKLLKERGKEASLRVFGISAAEVTERLARSRRLENTDGAFVLGVRPGGPAQTAEPALSPGDVIHSVGGTPVKSLKDLVETYRALAAKDPLPEFVTVEFDRQGKNTLTLIKPRPDDKEDPPRELPKAWIGVATQPVLKDLAREAGLGDAVGFRVTRVYPGTIADKAGIRVGDVVTAINGDRLAPRGMQEAGMFQRRVRQLNIGDEASLTLLRGTQPEEVKLTLERSRLTQEEARRDENRDFELTVRELTFFDRDDNRWDDDVRGVLVVDLERAGWARFAGIVPGDLIQRIDTHQITDLASYRKAMEEIAKRQPERVTFVVMRGHRTQYKFAEPEWKPVMQGEAKPAEGEAAKAAAPAAPTPPVPAPPGGK